MALAKISNYGLFCIVPMPEAHGMNHRDLSVLGNSRQVTSQHSMPIQGLKAGKTMKRY
jgi:hypothetical protein